MLINLIEKDDKKPVENELPAHRESLIDEKSRVTVWVETAN